MLLSPALTDYSAYSALKDKERGKEERYIDVVQQITRKKNTGLWFKQLSECVSLLIKPDYKMLLDVIFLYDWSQNPETFGEFLVHLNSAHGIVYLTRTLTNIVQNFIIRPGSSEPSDVASCLETAKSKQPHLHDSLKRILQIIPDSINNLTLALTNFYPHKSFSQVTQEYFLENIMEITKYCPIIIEFVIGLIVDRLIQIDVDIVLDEIPDEEEVDQSKEGLFLMEEDSLKLQDHITAAKKLDACISFMINYIKTSSEPLRNEIFLALMKSFDRSILLTHQCKYIQFIIFFICQLKSTYFENFVMNHLLSHVLDDKAPVVIRISASSYIASFLGRSKFAPLQSTLKVCNRLAKWIHNYIQQYSSKVTNPTKHMLFYSMVQSLFYIIIFKHEELEDSSNQSELIQQLDIPGIVNSHFEPLKVILSSVADEFTKIARNLKIGDFKVKGDSDDSLFEFFFPFEPCLLKSTATHIQDFYAFWEEADNENEDEMMSELCTMITSSL